MAARGDSRAPASAQGIGAAVPRYPLLEDGVSDADGLDAAVLMARSGVVCGVWARDGVERDIVGVMAATLADIVDRLNEAFGGAPPHHVTFLLDDRRIVVERMPGTAVLILAAEPGTPAAVLRRVARAVRTRLEAAPVPRVGHRAPP